MGKHDTPIGVWLSDKERFADLYNGALCNGKEVFKAEDLDPIDTKQNLTLRDYEGKDVHIQKFRDIAMKCSDGTRLLLLTCENQDDIHYAMPIRSMLYDSLDYAAQVKELAKENKKRKNYNNSAEFLSGMSKEDRVSPVIPLVFYYGDREWDACKDLHSLLDISEEDYTQLKDYIPNYKINLVNAKDLASRNLFHTDLQTILGMLQYKKDKDKLLGYIEENKSYFKDICADSYNAAKALLGSNIHLRDLGKKEETADMCKALEDFYQDGVNEGIEKGIAQGVEQCAARYSKLILKLSEDGKADWIIKIASDSEFRDQLYKQYHI